MKKIIFIVILLTLVIYYYPIEKNTILKIQNNIWTKNTITTTILKNDINNTSIIPTQNNQKIVKKWDWIWLWNISNSNKINWKNSWMEIYDNTNQQKLIINFLKQQNISKLYLYIWSIQREDETYFSKNKLYNEIWLYNFMKELNKNNIIVYWLYYVNDDVNNITDYEKISNIVTTIKNWNTKYNDAKFAWIQNDQEVNDPNLYWNYLKMLDYTNNLLKNTDIINWVTIKPSWVDKTYDNKNFLKIICKSTDEVFLMDYNNNLDNIINLWNKSLKICNNINIWIETWEKNAEKNETLSQEIKDKGVAYFKVNILKKLQNSFNNSTSFKWISIHDYNQYFQHIYWTEPYKN